MPVGACERAIAQLIHNFSQPVENLWIVSCYREPKHLLSFGNKSENRALNLESNTESNFEVRRSDVEKLIAKAGAALKSGARKGKLTPPKQGSLTSTNTPELPLGKPGGRR